MPESDTLDLLLHRIRGEFAEMPGLKLTLAQAARLWHLDTGTARTLLAALEDTRFLCRTRTGAYQRTDSR